MRQPTLPRPPRRRVIALALVAALAGGAVLAESGTVLKDTPLRSEPMNSASQVAQLKAKQTVEITARQGAWASVKTPTGEEGWARILTLRTGSGAAASADASQIASVFRTGSSGASVSTGVKGLSADELMSASANYQDVALLDSYAVSSDAARQFAGQVPLANQQVPYLPEPRAGRRQR
ncbi:SH3 domain-containing protein [Arenimonas sp. MALMAid1274]|uniref:SH3 domain-containing protein n=1 Tax=Arenimonas sp. MALMAid1274 TaxID=3411630 RepID=UPI003BA16BC3